MKNSCNGHGSHPTESGANFRLVFRAPYVQRLKTQEWTLGEGTGGLAYRGGKAAGHERALKRGEPSPICGQRRGKDWVIPPPAATTC
jgi:hypothetical protein